MDSALIGMVNGSPPTKSIAASPATQCSNSIRGKLDPQIVFFPSSANKDELASVMAASKSGFSLAGSAAMGHLGPIVGLVDIAECEDSFLFRVSLPGVRRDENEFSCVVENDGKVIIRGVTTTGETTLCRFSQVFQMQSKNLCPPGEFSISFYLPGPVNPQEFSGNFGTHGVMEGIVMKEQIS